MYMCRADLVTFLGLSSLRYGARCFGTARWQGESSTHVKESESLPVSPIAARSLTINQQAWYP